MPDIESHLPVQATLQTLWEILLDRIESPERYLASLEDYSFSDNQETYAIREIILAGVTLRERITIDERQGEIRYQLLDNPLFSGDVYNALIPPDPQDSKACPIVQFRMNWEPLNDEAKRIEVESLPLLKEGLEHAVRYVKEQAERIACL